MFLHDALAAWALTSGQAPSTVYRYTRAVAMLAKHGVRLVGDVTLERIAAYQDDRIREGAAVTTFNLELAALCVTLDWLRRRKLTTLDLLLEVQSLRLKKPQAPPPTIYDDQEFALVSRAAWGHGRWAGFAFETACYTGTRRSELRRIETEDFEFPRGLLHVRRKVAELGWAGETKGRKERSVSLAPEFLAVLREHAPASGPLFPAIRTGQAKTRFMAMESFDRLAIELTQETGVHVTWHRCRRTFTTRALVAGVPPSEVAAMLGHVGLNLMMSRYRAWITRYEPAIERLSMRGLFPAVERSPA